MLKKVAFMACMVGALALAMACSDDSGKKTSKEAGATLDSGGKVYLDKGGTKKDTGGVTKKDTGGVTKKDSGGTTAPQDCLDIVSCVAKCAQGDQTCSQKCISAAPAAAQTKYNAYMACANTAFQGSCSSKCTTPSSKTCLDCISAACKKEEDACKGTGGPATQGFGAVCDQSTKCLAGLECVTVGSGAKKGFCTKTCIGSGKPCSGGATGTAPYCVLTDSTKSKYWCAFMCKASTQTWLCPTALKCGTPDTNGQAICMPK